MQVGAPPLPLVAAIRPPLQYTTTPISFVTLDPLIKVWHTDLMQLKVKLSFFRVHLYLTEGISVVFVLDIGILIRSQGNEGEKDGAQTFVFVVVC